VEFAKKANEVGPWISANEERLRSIALNMQGPLEVNSLLQYSLPTVKLLMKLVSFLCKVRVVN